MPLIAFWEPVGLEQLIPSHLILCFTSFVLILLKLAKYER